MRPTIVGVAVALTVLPACVTTLGLQNPRPNIALVPHQQSLRLELSAAVDDNLELQEGNNTVKVMAWRATLADGFRSGFSGGYRLVPDSASDLTLTLDEVHVELGDFRNARARIQFKATLWDHGAILRRSAGTAMKAAAGFAGPVATVSELLAADVEGAVEAMYEQIATDVLR